MLKEGDEVALYLDEVILENSKKKAKFSHLVEFWKLINGKIGTIIKIEDDKIWVKGKTTEAVRAFTKDTLRKI